MCLASVDKITKTGIKYAYKVLLKRRSGEIVGEYRNPSMVWEIGYKVNEWSDSDSREIKICADDLTKYEPGFHSFIDRGDVEFYRFRFYNTDRVLVKVEIDEIVASGDQQVSISGKEYVPCVVSRKIKIVEILS